MAGSAFIAVITISLALKRDSLRAVSSAASNDIKEA
jgi:hypothetical protein